VPYSPLDPSIAATLPAALAAVPETADLDQAGTDETARLAGDFFRRIRGASEDPQDSAYQQRWLEAQEESDARMRASLGGQAWLDHHREAHRQAREPAVDGAARNAAGG
jgi:hypothetical protein